MIDLITKLKFAINWGYKRCPNKHTNALTITIQRINKYECIHNAHILKYRLVLYSV